MSKGVEKGLQRGEVAAAALLANGVFLELDLDSFIGELLFVNIAKLLSGILNSPMLLPIYPFGHLFYSELSLCELVPPKLRNFLLLKSSSLPFILLPPRPPNMGNSCS